MAGEAVQIDGLRELRRALDQLGGDLPKELRLSLNDFAHLVIQKTMPKVPSDRARWSLKPVSTQTAARIRGGGRAAPFYPWHEFGGRRVRKFKNGKTHRDPVGRKVEKIGRWLYPTFYQLRDSGEVQRFMQERMLRLARRAGLIVEVS